MSKLQGGHVPQCPIAGDANAGKWYYAEYSTFVVLPEAHNYKLRMSGYSGNAGRDSFGVHIGQVFSTYDRDNERWPAVNCAADFGGGFWHKSCYWCGVNSSRNADYFGNYFHWRDLPGDWQLQKSRMWLLCK